MAKFKVHPVGFDEHGRAVAEVCKDSTDGEAGDVIVCKRLAHGQPIPPGFQVGRARQTEDGHVEIRSVEMGENAPVYEDQSEGSGPAKYNSKAFRDGWERTFN